MKYFIPSGFIYSVEAALSYDNMRSSLRKNALSKAVKLSLLGVVVLIISLGLYENWARIPIGR